MAETQLEETTEQQTQADQSVTEPADATEVQAAELEDVGPQAGTGQAGQIDLLLDTPMPVSVQLGQVRLSVGELLQLSEGSVLKLDRMAGEPVDLFLRDARLATGQLVVVGEQLGVRIGQILSPGGSQVQGPPG
jgi:flagellar motor switch protein FliN/FliY